MERLKYFDQYLQEGLDATVEVDDNKDDELKISLPNDNSDRTFIRRNGIIYLIDEDGKESEFSKEDPDYEYVKKIFKSIKFAKEEDRRNQVKRISGDDEDVEDDVEQLYDEDMSSENPTIRRNHDDICYDILDLINAKMKDNIYAYIPLKQLSEKQLEWFTKNTVKDNGLPQNVGKGEYLLPILFPDVRKKNPSKEKGDNAITKNGKDFMNIEVKTANCAFPFELIDCPKDKEKYRYSCAFSIAYYLVSRNFTNNQGCYLILFDNKKDSNNFDGICVIKCDETQHLTNNQKTFPQYLYDLTNKLYDIVKIDDNRTLTEGGMVRRRGMSTSKDTFSIIYTGDDNGNILCILSTKIYKEYNPDWKSNKKLIIDTKDGEKTVTRRERFKTGGLTEERLNEIKTELSKDTQYKTISEDNLQKLSRYIYMKYRDEDINTHDICNILGIIDKKIDNPQGKEYLRIQVAVTTARKFFDNKKHILQELKNGKSYRDIEYDLKFPPSTLKSTISVYELVSDQKLEDILKDYKETSDVDKFGDKIITLAQEGKTAKEIADELGKNIQSIYVYCRKHHIEFNRKKKDIDKDKVISLVNQGKTLKEIADELGNSSAAIYTFCKKNDIDFNKVSRGIINKEKLLSLIDAGKTTKEIADELNVNINSIYNYCKKYNIDLNRQRQKVDKEKIKELKQKGLSISQISKELGCGLNTVYRILSKKDISESFHVFFYGEMFND